jgi:hypothetical protein
MRRLCTVVALLALAAPAFAKGKAAPKAKGQAPSARAISELMGKFKWGMTPEEVLKPITEDIHNKYAEQIKKEMDIYKQDQLRQKEQEDVKTVKDSLIKFDGQKTGWDTSIVDKEFGQRNSESMMVLWEKDQRRFLFFWNGKLYKQYIAFNAEHPVFAGKTFDDFANLIQNRYGRAEMKMATLRTKDDVTLDHLEWPAAGDFTLWAIDQSGFYGNFCLKLQQTSVFTQVERGRAEHNPKTANRSALIDAVTAPEQVKGDPNADIVDDIVGRKAQRTNQGGGGGATTDTSPAGDAKKKKKKETSNDPLGDTNF